MHGMDVSQPSTRDAILWGADYAPLTYLAEPMRLFSSMFFHFGLIHLMLNMWALYILVVLPNSCLAGCILLACMCVPD